LLGFGGGRLFRFLGAPLGIFVGLLWGPVLIHSFMLPLPDGPVALVSAAALGLLGIFFPPGLAFFLFGIPAGLTAGHLAGPQDWFLGFFPAFLLCGTLAGLFQRYVGAIAASLPGAWLFVLGAMSALSPMGGLSERAASHPLGVIAVAGVLAVVGTVYQMAFRASPDELDRRQVESARTKRRAAEKAAVEKRWSGYGKRGPP
jgi:hypothetical protein